MEDSSWPVVGLSAIILTTGLLFLSSQTGFCTYISSRVDVAIVRQRLGQPCLREQDTITVSEVGIWIGEAMRQASYPWHTDNISEKYIFLHVLTLQGNYLVSASTNIIKCSGSLFA
jgi:hypothetical protein